MREKSITLNEEKVEKDVKYSRCMKRCIKKSRKKYNTIEVNIQRDVIL